jgi:hypothetical protein
MADGRVYRLHREVEAFVRYVSPTREEDEVRSLVVTMISQAITGKFPDAKVLAFGSYETKLYLPLGYVADATHRRLFNLTALKRHRLSCPLPIHGVL